MSERAARLTEGWKIVSIEMKLSKHILESYLQDILQNARGAHFTFDKSSGKQLSLKQKKLHEGMKNSLPVVLFILQKHWQSRLFLPCISQTLEWWLETPTVRLESNCNECSINVTWIPLFQVSSEQEWTLQEFRYKLFRFVQETKEEWAVVRRNWGWWGSVSSDWRCNLFGNNCSYGQCLAS